LQIIRLSTQHYLNNFSIADSVNHDILKNFKNHGLCLSIGNFDGIHLGHQSIISQLKETSKKYNLPCAIMTFEPHPLAYFNQNKKTDFRITTLKQKIKILEKHKIDYLILQNFNKNFSELSADFFIRNILEKTLNVKYLTIGYDFTFGKNRQGNFKDLELAKFNLCEITPVKINIASQEYTCSSSLVRSLLKSGNIDQANKILGHNFAIENTVIQGKKLAKTLGYPTANQICKPQQIQPKFGVYESLVKLANHKNKMLAITNFGLKPTIFNNLSQPLFETHILNFEENLYNKKITVELIRFIRNEIKFSSIEELKNQINLDITNLK
jgi:riboflavin kinase/FMN adenylyltransferase